jgi:NADH-quinone oxidoreductase subunit I
MAVKRHPAVGYFADIWQGIVTTILGMKLTLGHIFKKPFTMQYPEVRPVVPEGARGLHLYKEEDCIGCSACVKICPVEAVALAYEGRGKDCLISRYDIDYQRCLFCNLCCEVCPTDCLVMGKEWDLSCYDRAGCVKHFAAPKTPEQIESFKAEFARKEAEKKKKQAEARAKKEAETKAAESETAEKADPPQEPTA